MKLLIAATEFSPLARTGGLGEAVSGIAHAMAKLGHDVTVAMPGYRHLRGVGQEVTEAHHDLALRRHHAGQVAVILVDDPAAFDREGIYGDRPGEGYEDQWWRFARYSAAIRTLSQEFDLLHLHDAHVGPAALGAPVPTVFTVHNAAYSILGPLTESAAFAGVPEAALAPGAALEWYGQANFMKAGVMGADRVTTVSPSFARQLSEDADISGGLSGVLAALQHPVVGIVNGIDAAAWDPASDATLASTFSADSLRPRRKNRAALLSMAGMVDGMIFGNVGRMSEQKGLGLLDDDLEILINAGLRLVLVGNGELDDLVDGWATRFPHAVWHRQYSEQLSRLVSAATDAYLMPSMFEPCGIGQMYAMRYGSVPVVRLTGGLADTVRDLDEVAEGATGFGFRLFEPIELSKTIRRAMRVFHDSPKTWTTLQRNGMRLDQSWDVSAKRYVEVYEAAISSNG